MAFKYCGQEVETEGDGHCSKIAIKDSDFCAEHSVSNLQSLVNSYSRSRIEQKSRIKELEENLTMALCHANKCVSERDHFLDLLTIARNHLKTIKHTECDAYKVAGMGLIKTRHCNCSEYERQCCDMCTGWDDATLKGKTHLKDKDESR